jgi:hypothetical protein
MAAIKNLGRHTGVLFLLVDQLLILTWCSPFEC